MPFAARNEDGVWRLCLRKGPTYVHLWSNRWPTVEARFPSQAKAKACADELNEKCWKAYEASRPDRKRNRQPSPMWEMIEIIANHNGLTGDDLVILYSAEPSDA